MCIPALVFQDLCCVFNVLKHSGNVSRLCNFAIGIPYRIIMDKREELRITEDLMVREGKYITEDTSSGCTRSFSLAAMERNQCASKPCAFMK